MAYHAPFGTDETPEFFTKIVGSKEIDFVRCQQAEHQRFYDNVDILSYPQYRYLSREWSQFYGFKRNFAMMKNGSIYHTVAPWEYGKNKEIVKPMKKMFPRDQFIVRNQDLSPREIKQVLPPIGAGSMRKEEKQLLKRALNDIFATIGMDCIIDLKNDFLTVDIRHEGVLPFKSVLNLMKERKIVLDRDLTKLLVNIFKKQGTEKLYYMELISFFKSAAVENKMKDTKYGVESTLSKKAPRYSEQISDISNKPNMTLPNGVDYMKPISVNVQARTEVKRAAMARKDKSLLAEMEKSFKGFRGDPMYLVKQFKKNLETKKGRDKVVTTYQLKDMAIRHQLPFNNALIDKMFDRLDPTGTGNIYWEEFVEFLQKALPVYQDLKPQKPPWENKAPLRSIAGDQVTKEKKEAAPQPEKSSNEPKVKETTTMATKGDKEQKARQEFQKRSKETDSSEEYVKKKKDARRPESRLEKYILLIKDLRKRADPQTDLLDAEEARRLLQSYDVMFQLGMPNPVINEIIERSDFDGTVDVNDVIGYLGGI